MTKLAFLLPALALTLVACGEEPAPAPAPAPTQTVAPLPTEGLAAPNEAVFSEAFAKACPAAEAVSTALCKRAGIGSPDFVCDYGLGNDEYRRNTATLTAGEGEWIISDPATVCAPGAE